MKCNEYFPQMTRALTFFVSLDREEREKLYNVVKVLEWILETSFKDDEAEKLIDN